jgi:hypothetical protein
MSIHHQHHKKAEKLGFQLEESGSLVKATLLMRGFSIYATDAKWAIDQAEAIERLAKAAEERGYILTIRHSLASPMQVHLEFDGGMFSKEAKTPLVWWNEAKFIPELNGETLAEIAGMPQNKVEFTEDKPHTVAKVPTDGGVAYQQGFATVDCPFDDGTEEAERWDAEWDAAADTAAETVEPEAEPQPHSVVKSKYRAIYAERGHATHCGDELAILLNGLMHNKAGTNIEILGMICAANEVDISKYSRTSKGWQGRLRMTSRNMLASKVRSNGGVLKLPESMGGEQKLSAEWVANGKE